MFESWTLSSLTDICVHFLEQNGVCVCSCELQWNPREELCVRGFQAPVDVQINQIRRNRVMRQKGEL